jgi:hypothetical protein
MRKSLVAAVTVATLAVPATSEAQVVQGLLTRKEARTSVLRALPSQAPELLLKDERAEFFKTSSISVDRMRRIDRSQIRVHYKLTMRPDTAHRKAHWFPIRCRGWVLIAKLTTGKLGGDIKNYKCVTVLPKT